MTFFRESCQNVTFYTLLRDKKSNSLVITSATIENTSQTSQMNKCKLIIIFS